ncbi:hypothetical protein CSC12_4150 [Klebsiella michiganensis]|nr:hypothetical protein CSC12_4150 [Klebsiella michiganensis]
MFLIKLFVSLLVFLQKTMKMTKTVVDRHKRYSNNSDIK